MRDRRSELDDDEPDEGVRWNDRAMFGSFRGLPWWAAVLIAFALAIIGTYLDVSSTKTVGLVFSGTFFAGAVGAVVFVERRSMFGPIVQPPLVLAITVPLMVYLFADLPKGGGLSGMALNLGRPLIDGFPTMAITTAFTVGLGILRVMIQKDPNRPTKDEVREAKADAKAAKQKPSAEDRPKRPRPPVEEPEAPPRRRPPPEGRRPAPGDEDRPKRPRPPQGDRPSGERRRPAPAQGERPRAPRPDPQARGGRPNPPPPRRPRPRDDE
jgi:hypothetical protein